MRARILLAFTAFSIFALTAGTALAQNANAPGDTCAGGNVVAGQQQSNNKAIWLCTSTGATQNWYPQPLYIGSSSATCDSTTAALTRYNAGAIEVCNGTAWVGVGSGASIVLGSTATATNPSRSGDVTTGLFSPAASTVAIATAGTEALRVTATGSVGIGTTTPSQQVEILNNLSVLGYLTSGPNFRIKIQPQGTANGLDINTGNGTNVLRTNGNGNPRVLVGIGSDDNTNNLQVFGTSTFSGNVGIGTTTPLQALSVNGNIAVGSYTTTANFHPTGGIAMSLGADSAGTTAISMNLGALSNRPNGAAILFRGTGNTGGLQGGEIKFQTIDLATAGNPIDRMTITDLGNVGIGTTSPAVSLDVGSKTDAVALPVGTTAQRPTGSAGMIRYNSTTANVGLEYFDGAAWQALLSTSTSGGSASLSLGGSATGTNPSRNGDVTTGLFSPAASTVAIATAGAEALRVTATGSVGIGTSTPGNYKLDVNGPIHVPSGLNLAFYNDVNIGSTGGALLRVDGNSPATAVQVSYNGSFFSSLGSRLSLGNTLFLTPSSSSAQLIEVADSTSSTAQLSLLIRAGNSNQSFRNGGDITLQSGQTGGSPAVNGNIIFNSYTTEVARISPSGNVGIGTTSPAAKLHVSGSTVSAPTLTAGSNTDPLRIVYGGTLALSIGGGSGSPYPVWLQTFDNSSPGASFPLALNPLGGNVGIGTTSPTNLLSLGGDTDRTFWMERRSTANTAGNSLTVQSGGATLGATNKSGGALVLQSGIATGTGSSSISFNVVPAGSSGTADNAAVTAMSLSASSATVATLALAGSSMVAVDTTTVGSEAIGLNRATTGVAGETALIVGTGTSNGNGAVLSAAGTWTNASDGRMKEQVQPLANGLEKLLALRPVSYVMKGTHDPQIGFIAQEVEPVLPEVVHHPANLDNEHYGLSYGNMVAVTVKAIQEQETAFKEQAQIIRTQQATINLLAEKLRQLESRLEGVSPTLH